MDPEMVSTGGAPAEPAVKLVITRRVPGLFRRQLHITDGEGGLVFRTASLWPVANFRLRTALVDPSGEHLMQFRKQWLSWRHGWEVFRGSSFEAGDLAFTVEQGKRFQIKVTMKLFLATNTEKKECDYRIEGSYLKKSLKVYKGEGDSSQLVAEMVKEKPGFNIKGKSFVILVDRNEDLALIAVLFAIRHETFRTRRMNLYTLGLSSVVGAIAGLIF